MKTKKTLNFKVRSLSGQADLQCTVDQLIMAGWVGRNREALQAHIDELAELGIPGPKNVPEFYPLSVDRLSQGASIQVSGKDTSGEVEFFLVRQGAETYVGLGSDQTDRALEIKSITLSKQICDKVLCTTLWPFQEVQAHWTPEARYLARSGRREASWCVAVATDCYSGIAKARSGQGWG